MDNIYKKLELSMANNRFTSYVHPSYELEKKLIASMQMLNKEESIKILHKINSLERAHLSKQPINSLKYSLVGSCTIFTRAVIEAGLDTETAFMLSDYYINLIDEAKTRQQTEALEYKMLNDFIQVLKTNKEYIYNPMINHVIYYIRKHIEEPITLQELASYVNVHPNYLSSSFKKQVGKTLTEYIDEQKINAIKIYMQNTNLSINEISYTFNFNYVSYFSSFFKKHTGFTPMEYKKQIFSKTSALRR
ncbi:AraC family transcriptional regulator [Clostridium sp. JN-9]|uniref:AraC family transcriptional regulator n=1 Tax=Clostridium sp. JN-9 TaxID=2507159 RepID=UPI000FFE0A18|nr:AraC family transcriptional regulator [Clostridium sp. JN-9]QAT40606.1 AraC family transcriptional regulator [Clostridium sp. JN-9]